MAATIIEALLEHSENTPNKICLADGNTSVSYKELVSNMKKLGAMFYSKNIRPGDKVIVQASSTCQYMQILLALQFIRVTVVPVASGIRSDSLNAMIETVSPSMVILNSLKNVRAQDFFYTRYDVFKSKENYQMLDNYSLPDKDDICEILFTTGTTGVHKGILLTYDNNVALSENVIHSTNMQNDNVELIFAPLNHSHGLRRLYANLYKGTTVVLHSNITFISDVFIKIEKYRVNSFDFVPSALSILLNMAGQKFASYADSIRYIQFGGASIKKNEIDVLKHCFPDTRIINMYGSTESGISIAIEYNNKGEDKANCIGKPTFHSDIFIVDENHQKIQSSIDNPGFIATKSRANMKGYYSKNDDVSYDGFVNNTVYSNDLAYIDEDGDIILLGRKGVVINVGGYKVIPQDIEQVALKYELIEDCACIGKEDPTLGHIPVLFVKTKCNTNDFDLTGFTVFLKSHLESYKMPEIRIIESIPRTEKGSVSYVLLKGYL